MALIRLLLHGLLGLLRLVLQGKHQRSPVKHHLEVERKYKVEPAELAQLPPRLKELGLKSMGQTHMTDTFVPATYDGDMIRLRQEHSRGRLRHLLTLKRWICPASGGKERQEREEEVGALTWECLLDLGQRLKGGSLPAFSKQRALFAGSFNGLPVEVALDQVEGLGSFSGTYVEIEVLVPADKDVTAARNLIERLSRQILGENPRVVERSYMQMLYEVCR